MRVVAGLAVAGAILLSPAIAAAQEVFLVNGIGGTVTWSIDGGAPIVTPKGKGVAVPVTSGPHKLTMNAPPAPGQNFSIGLTMDADFKEEELVVQGDRKFWCYTAVVFMSLPMALPAEPKDCLKMTKGFAKPD